MSKLHDDERFKHVNYYYTDISVTFARIRRKMKEEAERKAEEEKNVVPLRKTK